MSSQTLKVDQFEVETIPARKPSSQIFSMLAAIPAQFRNAREIERQAKRLYAMNDNALGKIGLDRARISACLMESYKQ